MGKEKVPVQKGSINVREAQKTQKFCTRMEKEMQDTRHAMMKREMQTMDMFEPKR